MIASRPALAPTAYAALRAEWEASVASIGIDPATVSRRKMAHLQRQSGAATITDLARRYGISVSYASRIIHGYLPVCQTRPHYQRRPRKRFEWMPLATYQAIRSVWRECLVTLGLDPDNPPVDATPNALRAELRDAGLPNVTTLAARFGVSTCIVSTIIAGKRLHRDERKAATDA